MIGNLARRAVELAVLFLAAVTFFLVPFGRRTLFQHLRAVMSTEPAEEMKREVEAKGRMIASELEGQAKTTLAPASSPATSSAPNAPRVAPPGNGK